MSEEVTVHIEDNTKEIEKFVDQATTKILTEIGISVERWAKKLCPVGTPESTGKPGYMGGTLRGSITNQVRGKFVTIGSNVEYAPYVELGTGPYFEPPPEWVEIASEKGSGTGSGYVHPRPFLRPAITDHYDDIKTIIESNLK